ncbi:MAG: hypothetical protein LW832_06710 [Parachlamydia sp.]|nr:hypothetical protein [Parachlamydia sp.]
MIKLINKIVVFTIGVVVLSSCARQISSNVYTARQVGEVSMTYTGVIENIRVVNVEEGEQLEENQLGLATGGLAGGVIGSTVGRGHFLPTAIGAIAGAVSGTLVEKKLKQQTAYEYLVRLNDGALLTIVQGMDQPLGIGEPVYVHVSPCGRSRISPQSQF